MRKRMHSRSRNTSDKFPLNSGLVSTPSRYFQLATRPSRQCSVVRYVRHSGVPYTLPGGRQPLYNSIYCVSRSNCVAIVAWAKVIRHPTMPTAGKGASRTFPSRPKSWHSLDSSLSSPFNELLIAGRGERGMPIRQSGSKFINTTAFIPS